MGQYYKPILFAEDKKTPLFNIHTWDFQCGLKLTEHSYIGNPVLGAIEKMICDKPTCLVWAGDYADVEDCLTQMRKLYKKLKEGDMVQWYFSW